MSIRYGLTRRRAVLPGTGARLVAVEDALALRRMLARHERDARAVVLRIAVAVENLAVADTQGRHRRTRPVRVHGAHGLARAMEQAEELTLGEARSGAQVHVYCVLQVAFLVRGALVAATHL
jgi:hypothetical protein